MEPIESEEEYEEKRSELIEAAKETKKDLESEQREILDEISSEHGGELVETTVNIAGDYTATVNVHLNGDFINRLSAIENRVGQSEDEISIREIENVMDEAATILADIIEEPEYDKDLFYGIYEEEGPITLGNLIERVFDAIEKEQERKMGEVEGFRKTQ